MFKTEEINMELLFINLNLFRCSNRHAALLKEQGDLYQDFHSCKYRWNESVLLIIVSDSFPNNSLWYHQIDLK